MQRNSLEQRIAGVAALDQPVRRDLHRLLSARGDWISRDQAAEALGVARSVAAFHLDKLEGAGVVEVSFERTTGRSGPGAGRTSKLYRLAAGEVTASVPDRHYDLAGSLLAAAVADSTATNRPVAESLSDAARTAGRLLGDEIADVASTLKRRADRRAAVLDVLARHGYEPHQRTRNEIALANCPFHRLAEEHRSLVCGMNLEFLSGVLEGVGDADRLSARLAPEPGFCCVRITSD